MLMSMLSTNLVFEFLSTWHRRFLEAVAFFDLIGGAQQGHWDRFQSAVSNHWETRLLIGSIHFLHLTFESISKPKILSQRWVIRMSYKLGRIVSLVFWAWEWVDSRFWVNQSELTSNIHLTRLLDRFSFTAPPLTFPFSSIRIDEYNSNKLNKLIN